MGRPDLPMKSGDMKKVETMTACTAKNKRHVRSHWRKIAHEKKIRAYRIQNIEINEGLKDSNSY